MFVTSPGSCLRCWVGHHSITVSQMQLVDCDQASEVTAARTRSPVTTLSPQVTIQGLELSFGDWAGAGAGYTREWACSKRPHLGTVTKDCVLMENLPEWWVTVMVTDVLLLMVVMVVQVGQAL